MVIINPPLRGYTSDHGYQYLLCETGNMLPSLTSQGNGHLPYHHREHIYKSAQLCCSYKKKVSRANNFWMAGPGALTQMKRKYRRIRHFTPPPMRPLVGIQPIHVHSC